MPEIEIRHYVTAAGKDVFENWLTGLPDLQAQARIAVRINRLSTGNFGDTKSLGGGLSELRIDWGPGYRVYFARARIQSILLLCGGDKRTQSGDIRRAGAYWKDYKARVKRDEA
jgi:putative addiction module killer protein